MADASPAFGIISRPRPAESDQPRDRLRLAVFGDFSGRAARGLLEPGDALADRRAVRLDIDTLEAVIEGFATTLVLPLGKDGTGIEVKLAAIDDLHPDALFENVPLFAELDALRRRLASGSMTATALADLKGWGAEFGTLGLVPRGASRGVTVPADRSLSAFQSLIGDRKASTAGPTPAADLIARIVAPHIVAAPSAETPAMIAAVDAALSAAMRLILHSPEFQAVESAWRSLDLLARRMETGETLDLILFDVSAEELAVDLAGAGDLADSGFFRLLTGAPMAGDGRGGVSALFGLYAFEETPPHAELLARIAKIAAHVGAPFITSISPEFLATPAPDRHPLVVQAWDALRGLPESRYLGVATPRFLLRRPYGRRSDPIDAFALEEFTPREGLRGMLWANPAVLVAILLAGSRRNGTAVELGSTMSVGEMPYHYVTDTHGDQVALPCTERGLTGTRADVALARGFMPVLSLRGRDEVRLGSFQSVGGGTIRGPWQGRGAEPAVTSARVPTVEVTIAAGATRSTGVAHEDLDSLLARYREVASETDPDDIDAGLAALLEELR